MRAMGSHQSAKMITDVWLTPKFIIDQLGPFDLDPCAPAVQPWKTASNKFTIDDDGLKQEWNGKVWLNPPYGLQAAKWLEKLKKHTGGGIALVFARTETKMFFDHVWYDADALLFIEGRLHFHHLDGTRAKANAGAPSVLIAYGQIAKTRLRSTCIKGKYIQLK